MADESAWTISFNPMTDDDIDPEEMKAALAPYVLSIERKNPRRYELTLDDELPSNPPMGEVISDVIFRLGEVYPDGIVVGHLDDDNDID